MSSSRRPPVEGVVENLRKLGIDRTCCSHPITSERTEPEDMRVTALVQRSACVCHAEFVGEHLRGVCWKESQPLLYPVPGSEAKG